MYRSGDLARHLAGGTLQFLGRADHQVKLRGFRVEPAEIEAVLREHPGVRQAVVRPFQQGNDTSLVAYVVSGGSRPAGAAELRQHLADRLPAYMVPAAFVALSRLPLTPNGKLDLRALPAPGQEEKGGDKTAPRTPMELQLLHLWEEVLGVQGIGATDDFFELGGNSLLSVRLLALVSRQLGHRLPVSTLVESPTIEQMARLLTTQQPARTAHLVTLQPRGRRMPFLCVHPGHGGVSSYLRLARYLGMDQPFYGLQALDLDRESDPYQSVEELAALYLREVKERWPEGPYLLGGWSFGGLVAFEMAQQLRREDPEKVAGIALIDTRSPYANARLAGLDPELMKAFLLLEHAKEIARMSVRELPLKPEDLVGLDLEQQLDRILKEIDLADALPGEIDASLVRRYLELRTARFQAIKNYQPQVYPGRITLFRAADVYEEAALAEAVEIYREAASHPTYRWDELSTHPIELRHVPGNHESIVFEPNVQVLARELSRFFSELSLNAEAGDL
jgi:thioesterase domain-containing protein/aryl carrier-like protein